jgi:prevent-host-death family protein
LRIKFKLLKVIEEITAKAVRWKLTDVLDGANRDGIRFRITKNGRPVAVLLGIRDFEALVTMRSAPNSPTALTVRVAEDQNDGEKEVVVEK